MWVYDVQDFRIIKGTVVATKDRVEGSVGNVYSVPELWIKDQDGKERLFTGHIFREVRAGHEVAVVVEEPSGDLLCMKNLSSEKQHELPRMWLFAPTLFGKGFYIFLAFIILLIPAAILNFVVSEMLITIYIYLIPVISFWWMMRKAQRSKSLRSRVDAALADL